MSFDDIEHIEEKKNFTQLYNSAIKDSDLSDRAFRTLALIMSLPKQKRDGTPWKLQTAQLAKERKCSLDTMQRHLKELCEKGYAYKYRIRDNKGHFKQTRWFTFSNKKSDEEIQETLKEKGVKPDRQNCRSGDFLPDRQLSKSGKVQTLPDAPLNNKDKDNNKHVSNTLTEQQKNEKSTVNLSTDTQSEQKKEALKTINAKVLGMDYYKAKYTVIFEDFIYWETLEDYVDWCFDHNKKPRASGFIKRLDGAINLEKISQKLKNNQADIQASRESASNAKKEFLQTIFDEKSQNYAIKNIERRKQIDRAGLSSDEIEEMEERYQNMTPEQQENINHLRGY